MSFPGRWRSHEQEPALPDVLSYQWVRRKRLPKLASNARDELPAQSLGAVKCVVTLAGVQGARQRFYRVRGKRAHSSLGTAALADIFQLEERPFLGRCSVGWRGGWKATIVLRRGQDEGRGAAPRHRCARRNGLGARG